MNNDICKYYKSGQKCTYNGKCVSQLSSDKNRCNSFIYLSMDLAEQLQAEKQKVKELEEKYKWYDHYKDSALYNKDFCNKKSDEIDKYKQALEEIKDILNKGAKIHDDIVVNKQILQKCEVLDD